VVKEFDLAIIGAGPAGISAAVEAATMGASVALIDENSLPGGKVFAHTDNHLDPFERGIRSQLLHHLEKVAHKVAVFLETEVWNILDQWIVSLYQRGLSGSGLTDIKARKLIISIGALERILPFPGWTLPGVFSAGGLNRLAKMGIVPGKRILIAGSGPLQIVLAHNLLNAGASIIGIVNVTSPRRISARGLELISAVNRLVLKSGLNYLINIKRHKIPIYFSHAISRAYGINEVEGATIVRVDKSHRPIRGTEKQITTDCIGYGFGLIPSVDITRLCGCDHVFDEELAYWRPKLNERMETSKPGIFVAGDCLTVKGYLAAIEEGKTAATEACIQLGFTNRKHSGASLAVSAKRLKRFKRFARAIEAVSRPHSGLLDIISDDTVVCRCEEVTLRDIRSAVAEGARDVNDIKRRTRLGMGHCQGRFCGQVINELIWKLTGNIGKREMFTPRIPARPIPFGILAGECGS